ncbi:MAG: CoA transferase [Chloroflexi bacterium]|nr:CoA transferase [Chloroflexota bacterium]
MSGPLDGVRILDLSEGYEGYTAMICAEFGAAVVKVEPPSGDQLRLLGPPFIAGESAAFMGVNRGKQSIALAWQDHPAAREVLYELVAQSDAIFVTYYPDDAAALGVRYEDVRIVNPTLVYCSLTPLGMAGPEANYRASELELQGMFGHWRYLGEPKLRHASEAPMRLGVPVGAMNSALFAYQGLVAALLHRRRTGEGQHVDVSEAGGLIAMKNIQFAAESEPDEYEGHNVGHLRTPNVPTKTKDLPIYWGFSGADEALPKFLEAMGLGDVLQDPKYAKGVRLEQDGELKARVEAQLGTMTAEDAMRLIREHGGGAVYWNTFEGVSRDPQAVAMGMSAGFEHPRAGRVATTGVPWWFSDSEAHVGVPPTLGQHGIEILRALGRSDEQIERLRQAGDVVLS